MCLCASMYLCVCVHLCVVYMSMCVRCVSMLHVCMVYMCVWRRVGGGGECTSNPLPVLFLLEPSPVQYLPLLSTCLFEGDVSYFYSQHKW